MAETQTMTFRILVYGVTMESELGKDWPNARKGLINWKKME